MSHIMSSLATAAAANANPPGNRYDNDSNKAEMPSNSPLSNGLNQMDTEENEELGKHLTILCNKSQKKEKDQPTGRYPLALATHSSGLHCSQGC